MRGVSDLVSISHSGGGRGRVTGDPGLAHGGRVVDEGRGGHPPDDSGGSGGTGATGFATMNRDEPAGS